MSDSSHPLAPVAATSIGPGPVHPTPVSLGLNPGDYDWVPVPRERNRAGGWSFGAQRTFIEALADSGSVTTAARVVNMKRQACYKFYREPGAKAFARAWERSRIRGEPSPERFGRAGDFAPGTAAQTPEGPPLHEIIAALEPSRPADPFAATTPNAISDLLYREAEGALDLPLTDTSSAST